MTRLTLEQCKRLKELGFPQDNSEYYWGDFIDARKNSKPFHYHNTQEMLSAEFGKELNPLYASPTLEELLSWLETTDQHFIQLKRGEVSQPGYTGAMWTARANNLASLFPGAADELNKESVVQGTTPLEAVYNLAVAVKGNNHE